jgi:hypothetical protein
MHYLVEYNKKLSRDGFIEPSSSNYSSLTFLVPKPRDFSAVAYFIVMERVEKGKGMFKALEKLQ